MSKQQKKRRESQLSSLTDIIKIGDTNDINELAEQAKNGDKKAQSELLKIYTPIARTIVRRFVNEGKINMQDLDSIVVEAFNKFYLTGHWNKEDGKFSNYFHSVLHTCFLDWYNNEPKNELPTDFNLIATNINKEFDGDADVIGEVCNKEEEGSSDVIAEADIEDENGLLVYAYQDYKFLYGNSLFARKIIMQDGLKKEVFLKAMNSKKQLFKVSVDKVLDEFIVTSSIYLKKYELWRNHRVQ